MKRSLANLTTFKTGTLVFLFLLAVSLPFAAAWADEETSHNESFQKALQLREEGNFQDSEFEFKKALQLEPGNPNYHFELGSLYAIRHDDALSTGDEGLAQAYLRSAASELQQSLMIKPDFWSARFNLGVVYKKQEKYEDARNEFKKVLAQNPQAIAALMQIGRTYTEQGFYDEAESIFEDARDQGAPEQQIKEAMQDLEEGRYAERRRAQAQNQQPMNSQMMEQFMQSRGQTRNQSNAY